MFQKYIDGQYRRPSGIVGHWIGQRMIEQHRPENLWTVALLDVQPSDRILEVGFGSGFAVQEVAKHLATGVIAGIDYSRTMVRSARRLNARSIRDGRADLRYGEAAHLPFPNRLFDKVFSIHSLYFWPSLLAGLREIRRVLKPGGTLILTFLPAERWNGAPAAAPGFTPYSGQQVQNSLLTVEFTSLRVEADENIEHRSNYSVIAQKP